MITPIEVLRSSIQKARELIRLAELKEITLEIDKIIEQFPLLQQLGSLPPPIPLPPPEEVRHLLKRTTDGIYDVGLPQTLVFAVGCLEAFFRDQYELLSGKKIERERWFLNLEVVRKEFGAHIHGDVFRGRDELLKETNEIFQLRHVIVHKAGVIDEEYYRKTQQSPALIGTKIQLRANIVMEYLNILQDVAETVFKSSQGQS